MLAYVFASETLRIANKCAGRTLFTWETRAAGSADVEASNGRVVAPDVRGWADGVRPDLVLVLAGYDPLALRPAALGAFLRRAEAAGAVLGGIDTGVELLASFGLLKNRSVVIHHEAEPGFRETWPDIDVIDAIYHFDGHRLSSAGGTATGDAMLAWIASHMGGAFADDIAEDMIHGSLRPAAQSQRPRETADPTLQAMRALMLAHLEAPLEIPRIAARLKLSEKRLRSLCRKTLKRSPSEYYLSLRLEHARALLTTTRLPITEIAIATGFGSHAGFSRTYRKLMGERPRDARSGAG
jgi:AraC family carnitine catabolism transcriptional activator